MPELPAGRRNIFASGRSYRGMNTDALKLILKREDLIAGRRLMVEFGNGIIRDQVDLT